MKWLTWLLVLPEKLLNRLTCRIWGSALRAADLRLHYTCHVFGADRIRLGRCFSSGRYLWLDAIKAFNGQSFEPELVIGDYVNCSESVHIACITSVRIGNGVLMGSKVLVTDHNHGVYSGEGPHSSSMVPPNQRPLVGSAVTVGDNVFLGDGVVVLPGTSIGRGAVIAANAVVSGHLEADTMYAGVPARPIKRYDASLGQWRSLKAPNPC